MTDKKTTETVRSGVGVGGLLGVVFVTLKLCHVIKWSWWLVTAPFWAPTALVLAFVLVLLLFSLIAVAIAVLCDR